MSGDTPPPYTRGARTRQLRSDDGLIQPPRQAADDTQLSECSSIDDAVQRMMSPHPKDTETLPPGSACRVAQVCGHNSISPLAFHTQPSVQSPMPSSKTAEAPLLS